MKKNKEIIFISPYPRKYKESVDFSALATYSKVLLSILEKKIRQQIVVFAQVEKQETGYTDNNVLIEHIWKRNSFFYIFQIWKNAIKYSAKTVHIQQEVYCYGNIISAYLLIILEILLRLSGKKVIITIHGVLPIKKLDENFVKNNGFNCPLFFVRIALYILFRYLSLSANKVIVHNENLKRLLVTDYKIDPKKISVIPIPLFCFPKGQIKSKILHKEISDHKKVILFFGFLAKYKGLETLINAMRYFNLDKNDCLLLIAGNAPKRLRNDKEHIDWIDALKKRSLKISKNIIWDHRYIPDEELKDYFNNTSIIIFPYTESISSSGPVTFAVKYKIPFLISGVFKNIINRDLIYGKTEKDLATSLNKFFEDKNYRDKIDMAVKNQAQEWSNKKISSKTTKIYQSIK